MIGTTTPTKVFSPLPWQVKPWRDKSPVLLLTGSAGGGKSRLAMEKINGYCLKYPGAFGVLTRKVKVSMTSGAALFFEDEVALSEVENALSGARHYPSKSRFEYGNGSMVVYLGLEDKKQLDRLKSIGRKGGVDIAFMEEATEFIEADYNAMTARMRGTAAPWLQIILATNPGPPTHWIYRRLIQGEEAAVYYSGAKDNTYNPESYLKTLDRLTGVDYERLTLGKWVQASGLVYDVWLDAPGSGQGNVTEEAEYTPGGGSIYWAVDDGYSAGTAVATKGLDRTTKTYVDNAHPRVFLLCQMRRDGILKVFAESYACLKLSDAHLDEVMALPYPRPKFAGVDKAAAELRGRIQMRGIAALKGGSSIEEHIKETRGWVGADENEVRKVLVHPRCRHFRSEMASYRRDEDDGKPVDAFNHGPKALEYLIWRLRYRR